jgi:DNA-binding FadR family transcriptional regulator
LIIACSSRWARSRTLGSQAVLDSLLGPAVAGVAAARLTSVALDDPGALQSLRELLQIRAGMECWAGVAAALTAAAGRARRDSIAEMQSILDEAA